METFIYKPKGVCSREMRFTMENDIIRKVTIVGGCPGNLLGISRILENKHINEVIPAFEGVRCGGKSTSCPDQIVKGLQEYASKFGINLTK